MLGEIYEEQQSISADTSKKMSGEGRKEVDGSI